MPPRSSQSDPAAGPFRDTGENLRPSLSQPLYSRSPRGDRSTERAARAGRKSSCAPCGASRAPCSRGARRRRCTAAAAAAAAAAAGNIPALAGLPGAGADARGARRAGSCRASASLAPRRSCARLKRACARRRARRASRRAPPAPPPAKRYSRTRLRASAEAGPTHDITSARPPPHEPEGPRAMRLSGGCEQVYDLHILRQVSDPPRGHPLAPPDL